MKYGTSVRIRQLVGRLDKGEEFIDSIRKLCSREKIRAATFEAIGVFSSVDVQSLATKKAEYVSIFSAETPLDILSLSGNVSTLGTEIIVNASTMLGYTAHAQRHLVGGHLASGRVFVCEFRLTVYDDLTLERTYDATTGLPLWNRIGGADHPEAYSSGLSSARTDTAPPEPLVDEQKAEAAAEDLPTEATLEVAGVHVATPKSEPQIIRRGRGKSEPEMPAVVPEPKAAPATKDAWQDAIRKVQVAEAKNQLSIPEGGSSSSSKGGASDDDEDEEVNLKSGDLLHHPTLGKCKVAKVEDEEWVFIKVGTTGKIRKLALHLFDLKFEGEENGQMAYRLKKRRDR